jgi:uncharacterized protein (DUF1697 family)
MHRYVAFLRAINVGGHTVKMERLRALFEELGFEDVETFIASGNVVFQCPSTDAADLERRIEAHLKAALGYAVATFLRTPREIGAAAAHQPFESPDPLAEGHALSVGFTRSAPGAEAREKVLALQTGTDEFAVHGREVYWLCRGRVSESKVTGARIEKALGLPATVRNVTTVRKLALKYPAE